METRHYTMQSVGDQTRKSARTEPISLSQAISELHHYTQQQRAGGMWRWSSFWGIIALDHNGEGIGLGSAPKESYSTDSAASSTILSYWTLVTTSTIANGLNRKKTRL